MCVWYKCFCENLLAVLLRPPTTDFFPSSPPPPERGGRKEMGMLFAINQGKRKEKRDCCSILLFTGGRELCYAGKI